MDIKDFRDLNVWKLGKKVVLEVKVISKRFPRHEIFGLTSQMRRSGVSIPSNVAEGYNRQYKKEYIRFLYFALGSCAELETQTEIAFELQYMNVNDKDNLLELIDHESRMLRRLIMSLENKASEIRSEPRAPSPDEYQK